MNRRGFDLAGLWGSFPGPCVIGAVFAGFSTVIPAPERPNRPVERRLFEALRSAIPRTIVPNRTPRVASCAPTEGRIEMSDMSELAARPAVKTPSEIRPSGLAGLLDLFPDIETLSLDCFDTLVWRHAVTPQDVFHDAVQRPAFRACGVSYLDRVTAERAARDLRRVRAGEGEISLEDIYRSLPQRPDDERIRQLAEDELAAEMRFCFAHPSAVELLRRARQRAIPVTIVSDMYLGQERLERLLAHVLPADAAAAIGRVVCSSDHGVAKACGLFERVYPRDASVRRTILHVGDNRLADFEAASKAGLRSVLLVQDAAPEQQRHRARAMALPMLDAGVRSARPLTDPYRAANSAIAGAADPDGSDLGGAAFGPSLHAFARWLADERRELLRTRRRVKLLFLLRDGHLPYLAHQALEATPDCHPVRISRQTAYAASFRSLADIDGYLARFGTSRRFDVMARQLLLPRKVARKLVGESNAASDPLEHFCRSVRSPHVSSFVLRESARFRERMRRYLERQTGVQPGDTVVFVDLGYLGTAQRLLQPFFEEDLGVELQGRYLVFLGSPSPDCKGMIDSSWCDERTVGTLFTYAPLLDKLCSAPGGSVEDYTEDGEAVLAPEVIDAEQQGRIERVHARCVEFVRGAESFFAGCARPVETRWLRDAALAELARLVYFPRFEELQVISGFRDDLNLGAADVFQMFDAEAGLSGLRARGINFMEQGRSMRLLYPAELRVAGLELSLTLFAGHRFGLDIPISGWSYRSEALTLLVLRGTDSAQETVQAQATHDGYFSALLPLGSGAFHVGIVLGLSYSWVQVERMEVVPLGELMGETESAHSRDIRSSALLDGIRDHGQGLWECSHEASLVMIPGGVATAAGPHACRFVFRPIARRAQG